ncbi:MAG: alpha/beta hydrolase [Pseudomonadota bacterium]
MAWLVLLALALVFFSVRFLRGDTLVYLDSHVLPAPEGVASEAHNSILDRLSEFAGSGAKLRGKARVYAIREYMDALCDGREFESAFRPVQEGQLRGEWVLAPGADPRRRLLYIHGGAFFAGSPRSHRTITDRLSRLTGCAVFSLDYRLMPEHRRLDGILDCRSAYRWLLTNGPEGPEKLEYFLMAGDSAGGNLTLVTLAWARDEGLRPVDAAIAFSPATDASLTSPSLRDNLKTDPMLGPAFGWMSKIPTPLLWWGSWAMARIRPAEPLVSPLRGDLSGLPPVLVQASEAEMLYDDARRFVRKAELAGSPALLQSWPHMVHVWQIFTPELPEAEDAYANIA